MITKEQFVKTMERIMEYRANIDALDKALAPFGYVYYGTDTGLEYLLIENLETELNDKSHWISYFLYERNGDLSEPCVYEGEDHKIIDTSTWEEIYELICGSTEEQQKDKERADSKKKQEPKPTILHDGIYDEETIYENCTVQVLHNSETDEVSVGWWPNE